MKLVTIITPTYNRADKLSKLFFSLKEQNNKNFKWLIVDDGSVDDTKETVDRFILKSDFEINYLKKENGGKHKALNFGFDSIDTPLTFVVDSDDYLTNNAISEIDKIYDKYKDREDVGVFAFARSSDGKNPFVKINGEEFIESYIDLRIKGNLPGDMAEVYYTKIFKKYKFPEFENEKFLSEDVLWMQVAKVYKYVFINKIIYMCNYLDNGLTANDKKIKFNSPKGSMARGLQLMDKTCGIKSNIKGAIIYNCYKKQIVGKIDEELKVKGFKNKMLTFITKPIGFYFNIKWRKSINDKN